MEMRFGQIGAEGERLRETGRGLGEIALFVEDFAQVVMCLGVVGPQCDRLLEPRRGLLELALLPQHVAQVVLRLEEARFKGHGTLAMDGSACSSLPC